jgi:hypothetical protein
MPTCEICGRKHHNGNAATCGKLECVHADEEIKATFKHVNTDERKDSMKAEPEIVWQCVILRRDRDMPHPLAALLQSEDKFTRQVLEALGQWLRRWRCGTAPPLCLACDYDFRADALPPHTFGFIHSDDPRFGMVMITGVCDHCALKNDAALLTHASKWMSTVGSRHIGFSHTPSS